MQVLQSKQCTERRGLTNSHVSQNFNRCIVWFIVTSQALNPSDFDYGKPSDYLEGITPGSLNAVARQHIHVKTQSLSKINDPQEQEEQMQCS
jgi:hypothetical protein